MPWFKLLTAPFVAFAFVVFLPFIGFVLTGHALLKLAVRAFRAWRAYSSASSVSAS